MADWLVLLKGFTMAVLCPTALETLTFDVVGFLSIDNNSAEESLTLELEAVLIPVAAEAKLPM